jgi:hypothetical protein
LELGDLLLEVEAGFVARHGCGEGMWM